MTNYRVKLEETLIYYLEIEADSPEQAEELAFASQEFAQNNFNDNDSKVTSIMEIIEEEVSE